MNDEPVVFVIYNGDARGSLVPISAVVDTGLATDEEPEVDDECSIRRKLREWQLEYDNRIKPMRDVADRTSNYREYDESYSDHLEALHVIVTGIIAE